MKKILYFKNIQAKIGVAVFIKNMVNHQNKLCYDETKLNDIIIKLTSTLRLHFIEWKYKIDLEDRV
jgi:hypothetical protein